MNWKAIVSGSKKIFIMLLVTVIAFQCLTDIVASGLSSAEAVDSPHILLDGERVSDVVLAEDAKLRFEAIGGAEEGAYQWQIRHPGEQERWINITGEQSRYLWVTHSLVGSLLAPDGTTYLRCQVPAGLADTFTQPVKVQLSHNVPSEPTPEKTSLSGNNSAARFLKLNRIRAMEEDYKTYSIVINYLFDDNTIAFEPYGASVAANSDFHAVVPSPPVVGYQPVRRDGEDYIDATEVVFDLTNIQSNITINVIYEPALVNYTIHHYLQNVLDDEYVLKESLTSTNKALTGSIVGDELALTEDQLPGFKPLAYEKLEVAADSSTVIEIRYDRNYYLVDFDMNGGYGTEPVYTRYGASITAGEPIRHGYVFGGWDLVSYGGQTPTTEQKSKYALSTGTSVLVPDANLSYKARWITQETTYTMVFWQENADDAGYSYWGYLDNLPAMSGSYVSGQDYIGRVTGIDDEQYFTLNPNRTDKNVLVEGDGSTVVNVYYSRNYYTLTFKAAGKCTIPVKHVHSDKCYDVICGKGHTHDNTCVSQLICPTPEHTAHTNECIICGMNEHIHGSVGCNCTKQEHTHTTACWSSIGSVQNNLSRAPRDPEEGQIYRSGTKYYIYIAGSWYRYNGRGVSSGDIVDSKCGKENHTHGADCNCSETPHTHTDACYGDLIHTHTQECYKYSCGESEHIHDDRCYRKICGITENHSHTTNCNSSTRTNTVKTVYAKYGQSLKHLWPVTDDNGVTYNSGQRWEPADSSYYNAVLVFISQMPPDDFTLTLNTANYKNFTMNYYLQVLPGDSYDRAYNGKYYKLDNTIKAVYNYLTKAEDFFDIRGFKQSASNPAFSSAGKIETSSNSQTVDFYYDRITDHYLEFNNNGTAMDDKAVYGIAYEAPLKDYNFVPPYPENLEPNAYTFGGWYISPGCFDGTEVNWDTITMPEGDLLLYAKWVPVTHTVRVFKDDSLTQQIGATQTVNHQAFAEAPTETILNGNYIFQGWFYKETINGVQVEKAFAFHGIPVLKDMDIYAKWSSHVPVSYRIYYKLKDTDIEIADPTVGSAIAGHSKTFDAKAGDQLYSDYQTGYYPVTNSHTITMSADGDHEFTFYYEFVESMPYKVRYVDSVTGVKLGEDKFVWDNALSVVTETFQRFEKMVPDTYQKRLVLSADQTDLDGDGIYDANVITFFYQYDEEHSHYRVIHYIQNMHGDTYREYRSEEALGIIGQNYTVGSMTLTGFRYRPEKTVINGTVTPSSGSNVTVKLVEEGVLIEMYYDRIVYDYTVRYVDNRTNADLIAPKVASGVFGLQVVEYAQQLDHLGYELVSDSAKTHTISANSDHNIIEFLYQEKTVAVKYQIVGPNGCGVLSQYSENLNAISSTPRGSAPLINNGFVFLGWYTDEQCTQPVNPDWINGENNLLIPQKTSSVWTAVTYYARITALETDLTLTTKATDPSDTDQVYLFRIQGAEGTDTAGIDLTVSILGDSSVTVADLPTGAYTVTELTDWCWRYENEAAQQTIDLQYNNGGNELVFENTRKHIQWLDGNAVKDNRFE